MGLKATGLPRVRRLTERFPNIAEEEFHSANKDNADLIVATARALVSSRSGVSRSAIVAIPADEGAQLISFGSLSRILEGGTEERFTIGGASRGRGPKLPFVNPALSGTETRRNTRNREAIRRALNKAGNG